MSSQAAIRVMFRTVGYDFTYFTKHHEGREIGIRYKVILENRSI